MPTTAQTIGQRIALLRRARQLTLTGLGEPHCRPAEIRRFEADQDQPSRQLLAMFATRLACPLHYLTDGVPPLQQIHIQTNIAVAEQVLRRSDGTAATKRYAELLIDPATILLPDQRIDVLLGAGHAREGIRDYNIAAGYLEQAATQLPVGDHRWILAQIALIRCQRLAGDLDLAESLARSAITDLTRHVEDNASEAGTTAINAELLAVYADRGDHLHTRQLATTLAEEAPHLRSRPQFEVYRAIAYANIRIGDTTAGITAIVHAYTTAATHGLQPPARLIDECVRMVRQIPDPSITGPALERLRNAASDRRLRPDDAARSLIGIVRSRLAAGQPAKALRECDTTLTDAIGASPTACQRVIRFYGKALAAAGLRREEAGVALLEAAALLQNVPFEPPVAQATDAGRALAADRTLWVRQTLARTFPPHTPASATSTPYTAPRDEYPPGSERLQHP